MKEKIFEQLERELKLASWTDLVIVVVGVLVTLTFFVMAVITAEATVGPILPEISGIIGQVINVNFNIVPTIIMFVSLVVIFVINWYGVRLLLKNKAHRTKLNEGLVKLYKDEGMEQYSDGSIFRTYEMRYSLFAIIMGSVAALSIIVPLVVFIDKLTNL
jgi:amino acid transporter